MRRFPGSGPSRRTKKFRATQLELPVLGRPSEAEALRMVVAFYCIMEPEKRAEIIKLAETLATESQVVEGCTHFLLLERRTEIEQQRAADAIPAGKRDAS
jgi:hypothetical protein